MQIDLIGFVELEDAKNYLINKEGLLYSRYKNKFIKTQVSPFGYVSFNVMLDAGKRVTKFQHKLIAKYFIPNPQNKPEVNHINGIKTDNSITNLEWCTREENMWHSINVLNNSKPPSHKGKTGNKSKLSKPLTATHVETGEILYFAGAHEAARQFPEKFKVSGILMCSRGKLKTYKKYVWRKVES